MGEFCINKVQEQSCIVDRTLIFKCTCHKYSRWYTPDLHVGNIDILAVLSGYQGLHRGLYYTGDNLLKLEGNS